MKPMSVRTHAWLVPLILVAALTGCAKKQAPVAATPPPAAEATPTPPPATEPAPTSEPAPAPVGSGDFQPVFFDFDSYSLRDDARTALDRNAKLLRDNEAIQVTVEGHCDERGTAEYNQALGERRAQAARDYLVAAGIAATRLSVVSYGKERPFSAGQDEASWQQNRRAHFAVR